MSYFRQQLENWLKTIEVQADKVLDVGGGSNPVPKRVRRWEVKEYRILDNKLEEMAEEPHLIADINDILVDATNFKNYAEKFDVIFCLEVMEYVWEPHIALLNLRHFLKKGGTLYISFPFIYPHHNPAGYDYLRYTRWGAVKLLKESGFNVLQIVSRIAQPRSETELQTFFELEGMHPAKTYKGHNEIGYLIKARKI